MLRIGAAIALTTISVAALAAGRGGASDDAAAQSVQAVLSAARAGDAAALEKVIDRPAVREDLRRQMVEMAQANGVLVDGGPSNLVLDRMIGPDRVRLAAEQVGDVEGRLKKIGKSEVCLTDESAECVLTFARPKGQRGWRLVGMQAPEPVAGVDLGD
ncbi:DUF2939 domain-containing protein [Phenylobacterium sp.]|uniref:DUF2939 domain-containing protein n=1 Tax=Phenylobacterium sp. TaxID=1871053 RepID=UPI002F925314